MPRTRTSTNRRFSPPPLLPRLLPRLLLLLLLLRRTSSVVGQLASMLLAAADAAALGCVGGLLRFDTKKHTWKYKGVANQRGDGIWLLSSQLDSEVQATHTTFSTKFFSCSLSFRPLLEIPFINFCRERIPVFGVSPGRQDSYICNGGRGSMR